VARSRRSQAAPPPQRLILDSGAVIALSRNDIRARAVLATAWEAGAEVSIPSVVIAKTVRGTAKDAPVNRVVKAVGAVSSADESTGRIAGSLLRAARSTSTVDAVVVATAMELGGGVILTGDAGDLQALAAGHPAVVVHA
jgi:predicted nucleic acid-binding protein